MNHRAPSILFPGPTPGLLVSGRVAGWGFAEKGEHDLHPRIFIPGVFPTPKMESQSGIRQQRQSKELSLQTY